MSVSFRPLWSFSLDHAPCGLSLAREKEIVLIWDQENWIYLLNQTGERQALVRAACKIARACCSEDGSAFALGGSHGEVRWLAPDLMPRWEQTVPERVTALALDSLGRYLAVADLGGRLHLFDCHARLLFESQTPRPLCHLAFVPACPFLMGASDYGLAVCFDIQGKLVWQHGLVVHIGSLSVTGNGNLVVAACFSGGLQRYSLAGQNLGRLAASDPISQAFLNYTGSRILAAGLADRLFLLDPEGHPLCTSQQPQPAVALAINAPGDRAFVALAAGRVLAHEIG